MHSGLLQVDMMHPLITVKETSLKRFPAFHLDRTKAFTPFGFI